MSLAQNMLKALKIEEKNWKNPHVLINVGTDKATQSSESSFQNGISPRKSIIADIQRDILRPVAYSQKEQQGDVEEGKKPFFACFPVKSSETFSTKAAVYFQWESRPEDNVLQEIRKSVAKLSKVCDEFYEKQKPPTLKTNIETPSNIKEKRHILYVSEKMKEIRRRIQDPIFFQAPLIMIEGETGTGKELVVEYLAGHIQKKRQKEAENSKEIKVVSCNCACLSGEADRQKCAIFGVEQGIYTNVSANTGLIEQANGGILFLDEMNSLCLEVQGMLLCVFQELADAKKEKNGYKVTINKIGSEKKIEVSLQIICASNKPLEECVEKKILREDFMHRLKKNTITIPPLRERGDMDIDLLTDYFLYTMIKPEGGEDGYHMPVSEEARNILRKYSWPGNVRELDSVLYQARKKALESNHNTINPEDIALNMMQRKLHEEQIIVLYHNDGKPKSFKEIEHEYYKKVLEWAGEHHYGKQDVAEIIGIDLGTFARKRSLFHLTWPGE